MNDKIRHQLLVLVLFAVVAIVLYWPARTGGWYFDDYPNIVFNPALKSLSAAGAKIAATRGPAFFSFALDRALWGDLPAAFRWVNVALHLLNSLLVVVLVRQLTAGKRLPAILIGLLFLCHPVQSAAVSYIVQRMALLSAGFALASLLLVDRYFLLRAAGEEKKARLFLLLAIPCGILSPLAKENTVLLPLAFLLLAWYRRREKLASGWQTVLVASALIPLLPVLRQARQLFGSALTISQLGSVALYNDISSPYYGMIGDSFLPFRYFLAQLEVFWVYLGLVFLPLRPSLDYSWPLPGVVPGLLHVGTAVLLGTLFFLAFRARERFPLTYFGVVWVGLFMAVESSFILLDPIFVHRLYLPLVGGLLILNEQLTKRWPRHGVLILLLLIGCYSILTWQRNALWGDPVAFWQGDSARARQANRARINLATELFRAGRFHEAATERQRFADGSAEAWSYRMLGEARYFAGDRTAAERAFVMTEQIDPSVVASTFFAAHGAIMAGRYSEAEQLLSLAEAQDGGNVFGLYLRGLLTEEQGDRSKAISYYQQAIDSAAQQYNNHSGKSFDEIYAEWAAARRKALLDKLSGWLTEERARFASAAEGVKTRLRWARQLDQLGLYDEAIAEYRKVIALEPEIWQVHFNLGVVYGKNAEPDLAMRSYREALRLSPDNPAVLLNYGVSLKDGGGYRQSAEILERLLTQTPDDGRAWLAYGAAQEVLGDHARALDAYNKAVRLPGFKDEAKGLIEALERTTKRQVDAARP